MLEITYGRTNNPVAINPFVDALNQLKLEGSLYIGYPILATADESIMVDALLVSQEHGLVAFLFANSAISGATDLAVWNTEADRQDKVFVAVENTLRSHDALRDGRHLALTVEAVTVVPDHRDVPENISGRYADIQSISSVLNDLVPLNEGVMRSLQAALQRVATIKPPKRRANIVSSSSKGAAIRQIEREIANLDQWQKQAALESPDAPQRIRGLAGSGKTVVLALKAAYLHSVNPDWEIAVAFWSRALYQQFQDLVRRFSFAHSNDEPNWQKLRIMHAWGSRYREGVYSEIARHCGVTPRNFSYGRQRYGMDRAFEGVCSELLAVLEVSTHEPIYDAILVDEAQDLPVPFFRTVYEMTASPKRIVWAYDELQNLSDSAIPTLEQQFGVDEQGTPRVTLVNSPGSPRQDITLPMCYRNTPWALTLAHGLGLGTARDDGLVQSFDIPARWSDIGYRRVSGKLEQGHAVSLERAPDASPPYFEDYLAKEDAVTTHCFADEWEQAAFVARSIKHDIEVDELEHDDILVVLPNAYRAAADGNMISVALSNLGITSHVVGTTTTQDEIFQDNSVAIAHIFRSKGNEAPMVYILNSQYCVQGPGLSKLRNILFTAITRSRAWVRICGWGEHMVELEKEIQAIAASNYRLQFTVPTDEELARIRRIHRELSESEEAKIEEAQKRLADLVQLFDRGEISIDDIPANLKTAVVRHFMAGGMNDSDSNIG